MASIWKHPQSRYWVACFTDALGRRRKRSTKEIDRKKAQKLADQFEEATRRKRTARQMREVMASLHEEITGEALPSMSVRLFRDEWLTRKRPETAPSTMAFYTGTTDVFLKWLGARADTDIGEITEADIIAFRNAESQRVASKTVNHKLKCIRMLFRAARRDGRIGQDPTEFVDAVRKTETVDLRPFSIPELRAVLSVADAEWKSLILFGLYTGQRLSDLALLTWNNLDLPTNQLRLSTRKTGRRLILPLATPLRHHVETLDAGDEPNAPLHPKAFAVVSKETRSGSLSNQFADLLAAAGLREKRTHKKQADGRNGRKQRYGLSFHSLRRTATTLLHEAGVPAAVAQELIGHDSEEIHQVYVKVGREALEKAAAAFPTLA